MNRGAAPVTVHLSGEIAALKPGVVTLRAGGAVVWTGTVTRKRGDFRSAEFPVPAGGVVAVEFASDTPGVRFADGDDRLLAFAVYDVDIAVARTVAAAKPANSK